MMKNLHAMIAGLALATLLTGNAGCSKQEPAKPAVETPKKEGATPAVAQSTKEPDKLPPLPSTPNIELPPLPSVLSPAPAEKKPTAPEKKPVIVTARKDRAKPTQTVKLEAEAFGNEVRKSADEAARKFETTYVELTGLVRSVGSRDKEGYVTLDAGPESLGIVCLLQSEKEPWAKISRGQKVKLRGQWPDLFVQPSLEACEIVELGPSLSIELSAEALADEFGKNKAAVRTKYQEKPLIVTGLVVHAARNELGAVRLFLKGAGDLRVDCGFDATERAEAEAQTVGKTIRLVGEFSALESAEGPALRGCRVITQKQ